jgi:hypothetical protein
MAAGSVCGDSKRIRIETKLVKPDQAAIPISDFWPVD